MMVRFPWRKLFVAGICLVPVGCEPHDSWSRRNDNDWMSKAADSKDDSSSQKVIGSSPDDQDASSFFKNNRTSGAWSSEAREIESHLGAN